MAAHRGQRSLRHSEIAFLQVGPAGESQTGLTGRCPAFRRLPQ
jgi:hypothetical protein